MCGVVAVAVLATISAWPADAPPVPLHALQPSEVLDKLDLTGPALGEARAKWAQKDQTGALRALLFYYRQKYPLPDAAVPLDSKTLEAADQIVKHTFQWGPYAPVNYGDRIQWDQNPHGDVEWVAAVFRFYWALPLTQAFQATRKETYARAFVDLTRNWVAAYPLDQYLAPMGGQAALRGFPWQDAQTGERALRLSKAFPVLVHSDAFTPEYLGILLASLYDHQVKSMAVPQSKIFNKALFESQGLAEIAVTFPEFRESRRWLETAFSRLSDCIFAQTTPSGVHREWCATYHLAAAEVGLTLLLHARQANLPTPAPYEAQIHKMFDYLFAMSTPDLGMPMFGDTSHVPPTSLDRTHWYLYPTFDRDASPLGDPKYRALARLELDALPAQKSYAFEDAGMYTMRSDWGPKGILLALHCSMSAIAGHDHPDSGTFELYAYGRCLMPDSGFYNYINHSPDREWFRQTEVHQTLTLNDRNSAGAGKHLLWQSEPSFDAVVFENRSYPFLVHRRSVWFVNHAFFVFLDDAIGTARGSINLHFELAPGDAEVSTRQHTARTLFDDANVLIWEAPRARVKMEEEEGWYSPEYGRRESRPAFRYRLNTGAPKYFVTLVVPYEGAKPPKVNLDFPDDYAPGDDRVEAEVSAFGKTWRVGRDLSTQKAWCDEVEKRRHAFEN